MGRVVVEFAPVSLGPFAVAGERALAAAVAASFLIAAEIAARRRGGVADDAWLAVVLGAASARLAYVVVHADAYFTRPWEVLYLWQGGFVGGVGAAVAAAYLASRRVRTGAPSSFGAAPLAVAASVAVAAALLLPVPTERRPLDAWNAAVTTLDGEPEAALTWTGTPTVVNLWASWCGPCRREMPMLIGELAERPDVRLVLVAHGEGPGPVRGFLRDAGLPSGDVRLDPRGTVGREVGLVGLPTTLFVAADGTVRTTAFGELSRARVRAEVRALSTSEPPPARGARDGSAGMDGAVLDGLGSVVGRGRR